MKELKKLIKSRMKNKVRFNNKTLIIFLITGMLSFAQTTPTKPKDGDGNVKQGDGVEISSTAVGVTLLGSKSKATQNYIGIFGYGSEVKSVLGNAMGYGVKIGETSSSAYALGTQASIKDGAEKAYALGYQASIGAGSKSSYAIGDEAKVGDSSLYSYAIGTDAKVSDNVSYSYAIGNFTTVYASETVALGSGIHAKQENSVFLGYNSSGYTPSGANTKGMDQTYGNENVDDVELKNFAGTTKGIVTIGAQGMERRIQNVSSGLIGKTSTDAVNGSQLYSVTVALNDKIKKLIENGLKFAGNSGSTSTVKLGETLTIKGGNTSSEVDDKNVKTEITGKTLSIKFASSPEFKQVTAGEGTNKVVIGDSGIKLGNLVYISDSGLNANSKKIINVADGDISSSSKDAVNGSQLDSVKTELNGKISKNEKDIKELKDNIDGNNSQMEENKRTIAENRAKMENNTQKIKKNEQKIGENNKNIEQNKNDIAGNKTKIEVNEKNINTNKEDIVTNRNEMDKNRVSIATNMKDIRQNKDQIEKNKQAIAENTNKITKNTEDIAKNTEDIKANKDNIAKNTKSIEDNKANIEKNTKAIDENKAKIEANKNQIDKNKQDIKNNKEKIDKNEQEIEKNRNSIDGNKKEIAVNKENIKTNTDSIEKNRGEIDKNKTSIANNMTKIAENNAKIVNNTAKINTNEAKIKNIEEEIANKGSVKSQTLTLSGNDERLFGGADLTIELKDDSIDEKHLNEKLRNKINNAATKEELKKVSDKVTENTKLIEKNTKDIKELSDKAVKYDDNTKNKITLGGNGHTAVTITNLADGKEKNDAVNYGQLKDIINGDIKAGEEKGVTGDKIYKEFEKVRNETKTISKQLSGGIATTMAMASIPQVGDNKLFSIGAGAAYYNKQGGFALGISGTEPSNTFIYKLSAGIDTQKTFGVSAGFNLNFVDTNKSIKSGIYLNGTGGKEILNQLAQKDKEIKDLRKDVDELKQMIMKAYTQPITYTVTGFILDKSRLTKEQEQDILNISKEIKSRGNISSIEIIGYADTRGEYKYNLELGLRRAMVVLSVLKKHGINVKAKIASSGSSHIVDHGISSKNRRVDIIVK
ncbi:OmpA family protein [Caviibacter abscessus]|uniref:OmpA family protein n=1 Tax=Caviibacter abscessus TaxID=1766719 RepID=UPI00083385CB|nr:OmpA family protein [Caviibacter abscessus]